VVDIINFNKYEVRVEGKNRGGATGRTGGNSSLTPHKGHFCKSSKTEEKILDIWDEGRGASPTILEF